MQVSSLFSTAIGTGPGSAPQAPAGREAEFARTLALRTPGPAATAPAASRQAPALPDRESRASDPASRPSGGEDASVTHEDAEEPDGKQTDRGHVRLADGPPVPLSWPVPCPAAADAAPPPAAVQDALDGPAPGPDGGAASTGAEAETPDGAPDEASAAGQCCGDDSLWTGTEDAAPALPAEGSAVAEMTPAAAGRPDRPVQGGAPPVGPPVPGGDDGEQAAKAQRQPGDQDGTPDPAGLAAGATKPDGGTPPALPGSGAQAAILPDGQAAMTVHAAGGGEMPAAPQHGTAAGASPAPSSQPQAQAPHRQLADAIVRTRDDGIIEIRLDPVELGRVTVLLGTDHRSGLGIIAERLETLDLMRRHSDQLLQDLQDNGMPDARLDFMRQDSRSGGGQRGDGHGRQAGVEAARTQMPVVTPAAAPASHPPVLAPSRIDIRL